MYKAILKIIIALIKNLFESNRSVNRIGCSKVFKIGILCTILFIIRGPLLFLLFIFEIGNFFIFRQAGRNSFLIIFTSDE